MALWIARIRSRQRVKRGRNHQLEIALGQYLISVFEIQHFTLLSNAQLPVERIHGLGKNRAMRGSAAAAHRAAATMEEPQLDAGLASHHVKVTVRPENFPGRGKHAAILV